jgi:hypothetical protein
LADGDVQGTAARLAGGVAVAGGARSNTIAAFHLRDEQGVDLRLGERVVGEGIAVLGWAGVRGSLWGQSARLSGRHQATS